MKYLEFMLKSALNFLVTKEKWETSVAGFTVLIRERQTSCSGEAQLFLVLRSEQNAFLCSLLRDRHCDIEQGSGNQEKSGPPSAFINKVLLERSHAYSFTLSMAAFVLFCAELSSCDRPFGPQSLNILSGPSQKMFANF